MEMNTREFLDFWSMKIGYSIGNWAFDQEYTENMIKALQELASLDRQTI